MNQNTYKSLEDFINGFKREFGSIYNDEIKHIRAINIKPKRNGLYYQSQFLDLTNILEKEKSKTSKSMIFMNIDDVIAEEIPTLNIEPLKSAGRKMRIEASNFSILLLTDKFQEFTKLSRKLLNLPDGGCKDIDERETYFKKWASHLFQVKILKTEHDMASTYKLFNLPLRLFLSRNSDFDHKTFEQQFMLERMAYDYITLDKPFYSAELFNDRNQDSCELRLPSLKPEKMFNAGVGIGLVAYHETTKADLKLQIDKVWPTIENYLKRTPDRPKEQKEPDLDSMKDRWTAYQLHKLHRMNYQKIATILGKSVSHCRKMASDLSKEVKKLTNKNATTSKK